MKVECKKCHFVGDADEESLVEEGGECLIEYFCSWCDEVVTINDEIKS